MNTSGPENAKKLLQKIVRIFLNTLEKEVKLDETSEST